MYPFEQMQEKKSCQSFVGGEKRQKRKHHDYDKNDVEALSSSSSSISSSSASTPLPLPLPPFRRIRTPVHVHTKLMYLVISSSLPPLASKYLFISRERSRNRCSTLLYILSSLFFLITRERTEAFITRHLRGHHRIQTPTSEAEDLQVFVEVYEKRKITHWFNLTCTFNSPYVRLPLPHPHPHPPQRQLVTFLFYIL